MNSPMVTRTRRSNASNAILRREEAKRYRYRYRYPAHPFRGARVTAVDARGGKCRIVGRQKLRDE